ncbi:MAG TPA: 4Fe-4S dicluster domain-containing protein [Planctomycetota bacterium]|nr:4Fe-4S dicluster domain-containing protein [Planctomycetota bacterium]
MKAYSVQELDSFFKSLESHYDVCVPVRRRDGTRALGAPADGPLTLAGGPVPNKITSVFFPQMEVVLTASSDRLATPSPLARPVFVVGLTAQDADCLEFIDRFFATGFPDSVYLRRRQDSVVVCVSGRCGADGQSLKIAGGKCDLELICDGDKYLLAAYTDAGNAQLDKIHGGTETPAASLAELEKESNALPNEDFEMIQAASALLLKNKVPDEFWQKVSDRCIACTSCNLACPSCTCFDMFDREGADGEVERWRLWDSCQLDGFMREASGHNPMGKQEVRTRRRIHHRLAADVSKWGHVTCYLCGRCDEVCPSGIGMKSVCREMLQQYGSA